LSSQTELADESSLHLCPSCGGALERKGKKKRKLQTRGGQEFGEFVHGDKSEASRSWLKDRLHILKHEGPKQLLAEIHGYQKEPLAQFQTWQSFISANSIPEKMNHTQPLSNS
jgi:hypothetical protein